MKKKPIIRTYYPQSVLLPDGIERVVSLEIQESIGRLLPKQEQANYDSKTLFYDLFVQSNRLICIGPPFYNIGTPLAIKHKGQNLRFKLVIGHRWAGPEVIEIKIPLRWTQASQLDLEFVFKEFTIEVSCHCDKIISLPQRNLCLTNLQKNNPLIWVKDWCRWHIRVHGVQRIVLYDNGSNYWWSLAEKLVGIDEEVEIILVHWPYKYGPIPGILRDYKYAKVGALNHYRLFFGTQTLWCINLDIDEFLYLDSPLSLKKYLESNFMRAYIPLAHYLFPSGQTPTKKQARFYYHRIRYKSKHWSVKDNPKYICRPKGVKQMLTHYCVPKRAQDIPLLLMQIKEAAISKKWDMIFKLLLSRTERKKQQTIDERENPFFCHFRDLYTGWHEGWNEGKNKNFTFIKMIQPLSSVNPAFLVEDKRVIDKAIETGVMTELEISQES